MMFRTVCGCYLSLLLQLMTLTNLCEGVFKNMHFLPVFGGEGLGDYCESTLHNFNCSVGPKKGIEGDTALDCKMKRQKDPGGISLTFSSNNQSMAGDYEFDTQYRLLDFSKYTYSSSDSDKNYQRNLSFPCFMGFRHEPCLSAEYKVYSASITSESSLSMLNTSFEEIACSQSTYNITSYNVSGMYNFFLCKLFFSVNFKDSWKSTIAVAFSPWEKDVSFVFDPVPDAVTFQMYNVSLIDAYNNTLYRNQRIFKEQPTQNVFLDVEDGIYYILIEVNTTDDNCPMSCRYTRSHSFIVGNFQPLQVRGRGDSKDPTELIKMAAILIGSGVVLLLLLLGILCYLRRKKDYDVPDFFNGLLIYSSDSRKTNTLASEFAKFCMKKMQIHISYLKPQNDIVLKDYTTWFKREIERSKIIIIFWTPEFIREQEEGGITSSHLKTGVNLTLNLEHNANRKLTCVYFNKSHKTSIPSGLWLTARIFLFPEQLSHFCSYIRKNKSIRNYKVTKALRRAFYDLNMNNSAVETAKDCHTISVRHINKNEIESDDEDDVIFNDRQHISWKSKSFWRENQPLMGSNASMTSFSNSPYVKKKATFIENPSLQDKSKSQMSTGISKRIPAMVHERPSDSVPTLKLFGSGTNSEHSYSSTSPSSSIYSISRLQLKTIPSTLEDKDLPSQSSGYEDCEPIKTPHSSYESLNSSCTSAPHLYQELLPTTETGQINVQDLDSKEAYPNASVRNSKTVDDIDVFPHCMKCFKVPSKEDKTSESDNNDNYSKCSESITSLDIDTCEFT
ncbi:uncharacterized protein LOC134269600 [Saccostrea cucullata]|uniref:uncharacterized protein LOC134269600 n=1 Tax=Saccostrea cuccullata TaxID=36930 RepID=UPI002ED2AF05